MPDEESPESAEAPPPLKTLAAILPAISNFSAQSGLSQDDRPCDCGEWYPDHKCWTCHDAGFVSMARAKLTESWADYKSRVGDRAGKVRPCGCRNEGTLDLAAELRRMRVPPRFAEAAITTWLPPTGAPRVKCLEFVTTYPPPKPFLFLTGTKGSGKTHLAIGVIREMFQRHGQRGVFWPVVDLLDRYRAASNPDRAVERIEDIDAELRRAPIVVLDDYGAEKVTEFAAERVFRIVDERYREVRPLVVTSNADLMDLESRARDRLMSGFTVQFDGPSHRLQEAKS